VFPYWNADRFLQLFSLSGRKAKGGRRKSMKKRKKAAMCQMKLFSAEEIFEG
jgi:hypothetical protein